MTWRATSAARPWLSVAVAIATESTCQDRKRLGADCRYCAGLATIEARDFARLCNTNLVERMHLPGLRSDLRPTRRAGCHRRAPHAIGSRWRGLTQARLVHETRASSCQGSCPTGDPECRH